MKFINYKRLKKIEKNNKVASKKAMLKSGIIGTGVAMSLVILAPSFKDYGLFIGLVMGMATLFSTYTTTMYEIELLEKLGFSELNAEKEVDDA